MTTKEIREKETDHLKHELVEKRKHLFDLRSQAVTEKLEDPSQLRKTKKDIARMETILKQRATEQQPHHKKKSKANRKSQQTAASAKATATAATAAETK
jgi:large subunit ribosomal protein L29